MRLFFFLTLVSLLSALSTAQAAYEGQLAKQDRLILTSHKPDALILLDRDGTVQWRSSAELKHPQQVSALPDGRIVCATNDGAVMLQSDGSEQWRYKVPDGAENAVALHLAKGRILVAHEGMGELVELDDKGTVRGLTKVQPINTKTHGQFRYVGFGDGNYLVPMLNSSTFREIEPKTGNVVWEIGDLPMVTSAHRRPDGGTYIGYRNTIASYDAEQNLLWALRLKEDLGLAKPVPPSGSILLPSGNLLIALWHKHTDVPDLIEFDPLKKTIVQQWDVPGVCQLANVDRLPVGHAFLNAE